MGVAPAGSDRQNSGHHHLLIDTELPPLDQRIPSDFNHLHFGAGQTEATITLKPGNIHFNFSLGTRTTSRTRRRFFLHDQGAFRRPIAPEAGARGRPGRFVGLEDGAVIRKNPHSVRPH